MMVIVRHIPGAGAECEFRDGQAVAYGTWQVDDEGEIAYCIDHAPTQEWFDLIAGQMDRDEYEISPDRE